MISWIQRYFQRHFRIIFGVLLAVTIISFIFTIGSTPGIGRADRREMTRDYFGHNLASREEVQRMIEDAHLSSYLQYGSDIGADQERFFQRHFRIIFGVLLAVTIISFIFTIGSTPGIGRADRREMTRDYFAAV